ncbi:MAG: hypothetical protein Q4B58_07260 [Bacteroidales bacterium]|nr:hypothetical protein [Bacteroidales bacterium]
MKKSFIYPVVCLTLASCANDSVVDENMGKPAGKEAPISFMIKKGNISRADDTQQKRDSKFQDVGHYNFGIFAYKVKDDAAKQTVMNNYLVGYSDGTSIGYDKTNATTWAKEAGSLDDHKSPWFYEGLGSAEYNYTGTAGYYTTSDAKDLSGNQHQYLRYWDLAYTYTNFYAYAPYKQSGVEVSFDANGNATLSLEKGSLQDGYDFTPNSAYMGSATAPKQDRTLAENLYASYQATNAQLKDVELKFKHMGGQLFIRFYEDIPGYKVEIVDLGADKGKFPTTVADDSDLRKGIQATPAVKGTTSYTLGEYYKASGASVKFGASAVTFEPVYTGETAVSDNLMFFAPSTTEGDYQTTNVPATYAANLTKLEASQLNMDHYVIPEATADGAGQKYAWSPTIYYPLAQPKDQETGFTFHVTFRIIADDNKEVTTVHNATAFVPATIMNGTEKVAVANWQPNTRYIYTFKITRNASGTTNPNTEIKPEDPNASTEEALYPIVFDECTIEDYTEANSEHNISNPTTPQP